VTTGGVRYEEDKGVESNRRNVSISQRGEKEAIKKNKRDIGGGHGKGFWEGAYIDVRTEGHHLVGGEKNDE